MANGKETVNELMNIVNKLHQDRVQIANLDAQIARLEQTKQLDNLNLKRIEAKHILVIENQKQPDGQPLICDVHVKRAMAEDMMVQDKTGMALIQKMVLISKHINRKKRTQDILQADITALESKEKILILQAT
ncbi:hypothetical protein ES703_39611 [subsurface metagenome]